ncbi:uncharacterized protein LOC104888068 isoform X2 [Beta vulgaris subsp. vulgaris]|uniref:uncharacterized protein LOC104888068 isoform X2 n=1 Tax=Beta vulgaris subsp. vulgaris TaxID=3555 RepID=UPI00203717CE|nr:uncharacterized protein LOC104888068 isoform X2 [Beta vulgaris subsp. vulgaris]
MSEQVSCFKWGTSSSSINASSCSSFSGFNTTGNMEAALYDQVDVAMNDTSAENFDALHNWVDNQLADLAKHDHNNNNVDEFSSLPDNNKDNVSQEIPELDSDVDDFHEVESGNVNLDTKGKQVFEPELTFSLNEDQQGATWKTSKKRTSEQIRRKRISDKLQVLEKLIPHSRKMMLEWHGQSQLQQAAYATQTFVPMMMRTDMQIGAINSSGVAGAQPIYQMRAISPNLYEQPPNVYYPSTTASFEPTYCPPTTRQLQPHS